MTKQISKVFTEQNERARRKQKEFQDETRSILWEKIHDILTNNAEQRDIARTGTCEWVYDDEEFYTLHEELVSLMLD